MPTETELAKKWFLIDVKGKTLGPVAVKITNLLRGKNKPFFTPQSDCGDHVVVINAKEIRLARNKMETKMYYRHTLYPSGLRTKSAADLLAQKPEKILYDAVWGMMPRNALRKKIIGKLHVYPGVEHKHAAQNPSLYAC